MRNVLLGVLLLAACSVSQAIPRDASHDAGHDAGHDAPVVPHDAVFGDTQAADSGACATTPSPAEVMSVLVHSCALAACHSRTSPEPGGGLVFDIGDPRSQLVGMVSSYGPNTYFVIPGDVGHSFLWRKLTNDLAADGTEGAPMPQNDLSHWVPLPSDQLEVIRCWIAGGAR